jgi:hypothetical protein
MFSLSAAENPIKPVITNPSPETVKLLKYLYSISGKYTLTTQHSPPLAGSAQLAGAHK